MFMFGFGDFYIPVYSDAEPPSQNIDLFRAQGRDMLGNGIEAGAGA